MNVKLRQLITKVPPRHVQLQQGEKEEEGVAQHKRSKELCSFVQQQLLQLCKDKVRRRRKRISRPLCIFTQVHRSKVTQWWFFSERSLISGGGSFAKQNKRTVSRSKHELWSNNGAAQECRRWKPAEAQILKLVTHSVSSQAKSPALQARGSRRVGSLVRQWPVQVEPETRSLVRVIGLAAARLEWWGRTRLWRRGRGESQL